MTRVREKRNEELDKKEGRSKSLEYECVFGIMEMRVKEGEKEDKKRVKKRKRE